MDWLKPTCSSTSDGSLMVFVPWSEESVQSEWFLDLKNSQRFHQPSPHAGRHHVTHGRFNRGFSGNISSPSMFHRSTKDIQTSRSITPSGGQIQVKCMLGRRRKKKDQSSEVCPQTCSLILLFPKFVHFSLRSNTVEHHVMNIGTIMSLKTVAASL